MSINHVSKRAVKRCLCVFSRILGWRVFGRYVDQKLATMEADVDFEYLDYDADVFRCRVPWYWNISDSTETHYRLRRLIDREKIVSSNYDSFIFQGHQLAIPFRRFFKHPVRIIADTTPAITMRRESRGRLGFRSIVKRAWCELQDRYVFRPMFAKVTSFLVLSEFVKKSLVNDYGIEESRIFTVGPPIYEKIVTIERREKPERTVLLFVGNDFHRKGGAFLLRLYRRFFTESADLWIVGNSVDEERLEPSIRVFSNIPHAEVLELMLQSHVFVFPSYHDELGLVLAEAACAGLPIVARESGGQSEYVRNGENGYLLSPDDDSVVWKEAIDSILFDDTRRERFSTNSRKLGQRLCTQARFDRQLSNFLAGLSG